MREMVESGKYSQDDIIEIYIQQANKGNIKAMEWLADRMDGKSKEQINHKVEEIKIRLVKASESNNNK